MARSWDDDESLPLFFILRVLACILAPWTIAMVWWLSFPGRQEVAKAFPEVSAQGHRVRQCQTWAMTSQRAKEIARLRSWAHLCSCGFCLRGTFLLALWLWFLYIVKQYLVAVAQNTLYEGFDPYSLLGVDTTTKDADLSRAFRREAFKYHPDKNPDPGAVEKFLLLRKALDSLTEPEAMSNYKRYGNPDGPQFVQLFAVSSFIKDKDASRANGVMTYKKHMFRAADLQMHLLGIVSVALVAMLVFNIPFPTSSNDQLDGNAFGVSHAAVVKSLTSIHDVSCAARIILENTKNGGCCGRRAQIQGLADLLKELSTCIGDEVTIDKPHALFLAHVHRRHDILNAVQLRELDALILRWHRLARSLMALAAQEDSIQGLIAAIGFQRCLVQALTLEAGTSATRQLLQVPHFDEALAKSWQEAQRGRSDLQGFLDQTINERKSRLPSINKQALVDVEEFVKSAPRLEVCSATAVPNGSSDLRQGHMATLKVVMKRKNLVYGEAVGSVHAPLFPTPTVAEAWWLLLECQNEMLACKRFAKQERDVLEEVEFEVPKAGKCSCLLRVVSENYVGLDVERQVSFNSK